MIYLQSIRALLFFVFIYKFGEVCCQGDDNDAIESCPRGSKCRPVNQCRPSLLVNTKPKSCGSSDTWRSMICCPERKSISSLNVRRPATSVRPNTEGPNKPPVPPSQPVFEPPSSSSGCGKSFGESREGYVVGGEDAEQGEWPWAVAITRANRRKIPLPWCTGFLISKKHVISAAHCFDNRQLTLYTARIGHVDQTKADVYDIIDITVPETYIVDSVYNDIALLTLSREVDSPNFNPVCLPSSSVYRNLTGMGTTVIGWGSTRVDGPMSLKLKQLSAMPVVSNYQCQRALRQALSDFSTQFYRGIPRSILCAGFLDEPNKDSCGGDSGGPLMIQENDRWYAIGIVGFGYLCGRPGLAGGYTRISEYLGWIHNNQI